MTSLPENPGATRPLVTLDGIEAAAVLSGGNLDPSLIAALGTAAV